MLPVLLLLLPAGAFSMPVDVQQLSDSLLNPTPSGPSLLPDDNRYGTLSPDQKIVIQGQWGLNLDSRRQRLQNLVPPQAASPNSFMVVSPAPSMEDLGIVQIKTSRPSSTEFGNAFEVNNHLGISDYLWNGDMQLSESQLAELEAENNQTSRKKRQVKSGSNRWTNNTVYYFIDSSINAAKTESINDAIAQFQSKTCLQFVMNSTAPNRVRIYNGSGCFSTVGMSGGQQDSSIGDGCEAVGTVIHELSHALGVYHTQMRWDRSGFVNISLSAVASNYYGNFAQVKFADIVEPPFTPYEYGSVMHYAANAFTNPSSNMSIIPADLRYIYSMGNTITSFYDWKQINDYYGCSAKCVPATSAVCQNGGMPNPNNCSTCNCPSGYGGDLCTEKPNDGGVTLNATNSWQSYTITVGNSSTTSVRNAFTFNTYWISAPVGMQIQINLTNMWNNQCSWGCLWAGVELKTEPNQRVTSPRICCPEFQNQIISSNQNPAPLIAYNRYYYSTFTFNYKYVPAPPKPSMANYCGNILTDAICAANQAEGFCTNTNYTFQVIKYNCATTCNLCGIAASPCVDLYNQCSTGLCKALGAMGAEFYCAKSCGYCSYPN